MFWGHNLCEELRENYVFINKQSATFNIISVLPLVFISDGKCRQVYAQIWLENMYRYVFGAKKVFNESMLKVELRKSGMIFFWQELHSMFQ